MTERALDAWRQRPTFDDADLPSSSVGGGVECVAIVPSVVSATHCSRWHGRGQVDHEVPRACQGASDNAIDNEPDETAGQT